MDVRPDASVAVSGRVSRRTPANVSDARKLRDEVLRLVEECPRSESELIALTGQSKGAVKAALRRLAIADLVFSKDTAYRQESMWCYWPAMIADLRAKAAANPRRRGAEVVRATGQRIA